MNRLGIFLDVLPAISTTPRIDSRSITLIVNTDHLEVGKLCFEMDPQSRVQNVDGGVGLLPINDHTLFGARSIVQDRSPITADPIHVEACFGQHILLLDMVCGIAQVREGRPPWETALDVLIQV